MEYYLPLVDLLGSATGEAQANAIRGAIRASLNCILDVGDGSMSFPEE
jgi:hypothetical protein